MRIPGFTATASIDGTIRDYDYRGATDATRYGPNRIVLALPHCSNCGYACWVCRTRPPKMCGACYYCSEGRCSQPRPYPDRGDPPIGGGLPPGL
jgi:hypothetical protein